MSIAPRLFSTARAAQQSVLPLKQAWLKLRWTAARQTILPMVLPVLMVFPTSAWAAGPTQSSPAAGKSAWDQSNENRNGDKYIYQFPYDAQVADITVSEPGGPGKKEKTIHLIARGKVPIPKHCALNVELRYDGPEHIETLDQLEPYLITQFSAAKLEFDDKQLAHLKKFKNLATLDLRETLVSEKSLPLIGSFPNLWFLRLNSTDITGSGFDALSNLHNLSKLDLEGIRLQQGTVAKLKPLAAGLHSLNVSKTGLTKVDMATIGEFHSLIHLDLSGNKLIDSDCANKYLPSLVKLETLDIADTTITEASLAVIDKLPRLKRVIIRNQQFWTSGKPQKSKAGITFRDCATDTRMPIEVFGPLH